MIIFLRGVSFLLILLSCAFPLSRANCAEKNSSEKPLSKAEQKSQPDIQKDESKNQSPPAKPVSQKPAEPKKQPEPQKPQKHWSDFLFENQMPNWLIMAGWALASLIAFFTLRSLNKQVRANTDSANAALKAADASEVSAKAAQESAEASKAALLIDRPVLLPRPRTAQMFLAQSKNPSLIATFRITNFGKSPAIIDRGTGRIMIVNKRPHWSNLIEGNSLSISQRILSAGDDTHCTYKETSPERVSDEDSRLIMAGKKQVIFYGRISYFDIFDRTYETNFFFTYRPPRPGSQSERLRTGPKEYNKRT